MSIDESAFRGLMAGADGAGGATVHEPDGQLSLPTLEERARLFLRAVHGQRDFTGSEYDGAQRSILNAMASDIAAKSKGPMPNEPPLEPMDPTIADPRRPTYLEDHQAFREVGMACEAKDAPLQHSESRARLAFRPTVELGIGARASRPENIAVPRSVPDALSDDALPPYFVATHKPRARRLFIWSAAVSFFAGLGILGGLAVYHATTQSVSVTAQSTDYGMSVASAPTSSQSNDRSNALQFNIIGDTSGVLVRQDPGAIRTPATFPPAAAPPAVATAPPAPSVAYVPSFTSNPLFAYTPQVATSRPVAAPAQVAPTAPVTSAQKNIEQSKALERARIVIAAGDIETTRAALSKLANELNAWAALELGKTYDPNVLDALGVRDFPADIEKALAWYKRAQLMGSPEAAGLLESLETQRTTIPLRQQPVQQRPAAR
jgi:hypothetical protein